MQAHPEWLRARSCGAAAALRLQGRAAARCAPGRRPGTDSPSARPCSRRAAYLHHCPSRPQGRPAGLGGLSLAEDDSPKPPFPPAGPDRHPAGPGPSRGGGQGASSPQPWRAGCSLCRSPPALVTPRSPAPATTSTSACRGQEASAKAPRLPCPHRFPAPVTDPPESETPSPNSPKSDSNHLHVRPPGRNDTPCPSRPPKRRTNPLILHENTRVTDHTV